MTRRLLVTSLYGMQTRHGLVQIRDIDADGGDDQPPRWDVVISPAEARAHANALLQAAESAEMDEIVITFLQEQLTLDLTQAVLVLRAFRAIRDRVSLEREL